MVTKTKIALAAALIVGAASAALAGNDIDECPSATMAASKHPIHHRGTGVQPAGTQDFGSSAYSYATPFRAPQPTGWDAVRNYIPTCGNGLCP